MRTTFIWAALLGVALFQPAMAQESNLEQLTHCFDGTGFVVDVAEHGTTIGPTRQVRFVQRAERLYIDDGYRLVFTSPKSVKPTAVLLLENAPFDKIEANRQIIRDANHERQKYSVHTELSEHKADGLEVFDLERDEISGNRVISVHTLFHDASGVMATMTMHGQDAQHRVFDTPEEMYGYRTALLSRLGACMLGQAAPLPVTAAAPTAESGHWPRRLAVEIRERRALAAIMARLHLEVVPCPIA